MKAVKQWTTRNHKLEDYITGVHTDFTFKILCSNMSITMYSFTLSSRIWSKYYSLKFTQETNAQIYFKIYLNKERKNYTKTLKSIYHKLFFHWHPLQVHQLWINTDHSHHRLKYLWDTIHMLNITFHKIYPNLFCFCGIPYLVQD